MNRIDKLVAVIAALGAVSFAATAVAQEAPDVLVKRITVEIQQAAKADKAIQSGNNKLMYELVQRELMPHVDVRRMASLAVGRHWRDASQDQQASIAAQLGPLAILDYCAALSKGNAEIKFLPFAAAPDETNVEVRTEIIESGRNPAPLYYRLEKSRDGEWRILDINLSHGWLTETRKHPFADEIESGGIDALVRALIQELRARLASY